MKFKTLINILLLGALSLAPPTIEGQTKTSKKSSKTTQVKKKSSSQQTKKSTKTANKKTSTKGKSSSRTKANSARSRSRLNQLHNTRTKHATTTRPTSSTESDSLRLRHGGAYTIPPMGLAVERIANMEPMTTRFRKGDTTLTMKNIETLYFTRQSKADDGTFFGDILPKVDEAIQQSQYKEAYALAQKGLWRNPMHIGLIKRACELSEHQGDEKKSDIYVWQIAELFSLIQNTGDGKSVQTAMRVVDKEDALLYEHLWLEVPKESIVGEQVTPYQGCDLLTLTIQDGKGKTNTKYYIVGK